MRPGRLWAIARQDWAHELTGRQGLLLPLLLVGLLAGPTVAPQARLPPRGWRAVGDVPPAVLELPGQTADGSVLVFRDTPAGLEVEGDPPDAVRAVLDGPDAVVRRENLAAAPRIPGRSALFALISASTLSGAVASSIGGERSRRTLGVLLSASVSKAEIVFGKALAWVLFGVTAVGGAAGTSLLLGRVEPGPWVLPLLTVPVSTVALGFYMVRRATDVVAGTATSMRVLPAVVALTGFVAFMLGLGNPIAGALVPIGGALVAAGDTWPGVGPSVVAAGATLAFAALALAATVRDLDEHPQDEPPRSAAFEALGVAAMAAPCWWMAIAAPLLYGEAGNARVIERLPLSAGITAGTACLATGTLLYLARRPDAELPVSLPRPGLLLAGLALGVLLFAWHGVPIPPVGWPGVAARMRAAAVGGGWLLGPLALLADELLFRGWLQRRVGPIGATLVAVVVKAPLDPLGGLVHAASLAGLAHLSRSVWPGVVARLVVWGLLAAA